MKFTAFDSTQAFKEQVLPLLTQLKEKCLELDLPYVIGISYAQTEGNNGQAAVAISRFVPEDHYKLPPMWMAASAALENEGDTALTVLEAMRDDQDPRTIWDQPKIEEVQPEAGIVCAQCGKPLVHIYRPDCCHLPYCNEECHEQHTQAMQENLGSLQDLLKLLGLE